MGISNPCSRRLPHSEASPFLRLMKFEMEVCVMASPAKKRSAFSFLGDIFFIAYAILRHPFSALEIDLDKRTIRVL